MGTVGGQSDQMRVVIIGAGISGLACAFKLKQSEAYKNNLLRITLLEGSGRAGGIIETIKSNNCLIECGPDSFITNKPYMLDLAERLGLSANIIGTQTTNRGAMVVSGGRIVKLPEGFNLLAPTKMLPFLESPIISWPGKMRVLMEPFLPVRGSRDDESLADFVRRRFGPELLDKIAQAMVGGIYVGDAEKLSAFMTAERFVAMEQQYGSVIGGLIKQAGTAAGGGDAQGGVRYGLFCSFDQGMNLLIDTLMRQLADIDIRLATAVKSIHQNGRENKSTINRANKHNKTWQVITEGETLECEQLVLAVPAAKAARLLEKSAPLLASHLGQIEAASSAVVNLVLERADISVNLDAFGVVVPEVEMKKHGLNVIALAFASNKFEGRAPDDKLLLRAFLGGARNKNLLDKSDDQLLQLVYKDLHKLIGWSPRKKGQVPEYARVCRWPQSMPQFQLGHRALLGQIESELPHHRGLGLAGASYRGVGLPECVRSGEQQAEKILLAVTERQLVV